MQRLCQMVAWSICGDPMVWTLWSSEMILRTRVCFAYLRAIPSMQLVNVFFSKVEMIYFGHRMALLRVWEGSKAARIFPVWWGLVLAFGWDTLTSLPVVSYASRVALIASSFEMGSQLLGAWMGLTSGFRSRPTGGPQKPRPWKSEVQFLEMNSRVQVTSVGQIRIDVSTESIWKEICTLQFESGLSKRNKTKWPLLEGDAVVVTPVSGGCPLERVKKFSYCMPSLGRV